MSLVHWELFVLCSALNLNHNSTHQLPYQVELNGQKPTITKLQEIVSKGIIKKICTLIEILLSYFLCIVIFQNFV